MNRLFALIAGAAILAGCSASSAGNVTIKPLNNTGKTTTTTSSRTIPFQVLGVASLADSAGKILNEDPAGVVASGGGNIIASGAGNIIASGAGNVVASGAGNFALLTTNSTFPAVGGAVVHLENLDHTKVSKNYIKTLDDGKVTISGIPAGKSYLAVAQWKAGGKVYRTSAVVGPAGSDAVMLDPINQFIQARVLDILAKSGKADAVTSDDLKEVWSYFNEANISIDADVLADDATICTLTAFYKAKVALLSADGQTAVKAYMTKLGADQGGATTCN